MKVTLISNTPNPEQLVATAAKLCYSDKDIEEILTANSENPEKFVDMLVSMGHESPIEHISFTFGIEGVSRNLTHQLVRHRIGASYSQKSQRYVEEKHPRFIAPPEVEKNKTMLQDFNRVNSSQFRSYKVLVGELTKKHIMSEVKKKAGLDLESLESEKTLSEIASSFETTNQKRYNELRKKAMEDARYLLPSAIETSIIVTMNARALMNFFNLRCCDRAQWEIRDLANKMLSEVREVAPSVFKNAGPDCVSKGTCKEGALSCGRVKKVF